MRVLSFLNFATLKDQRQKGCFRSLLSLLFGTTNSTTFFTMAFPPWLFYSECMKMLLCLQPCAALPLILHPELCQKQRAKIRLLKLLASERKQQSFASSTIFYVYTPLSCVLSCQPFHGRIFAEFLMDKLHPPRDFLQNSI